MPRKPSSRQLAQEVARTCDAKKAEDIVILDMRKVTYLTDFFVIATSQSARQSRAVSDELQKTLKPKGIHMLGSEGLRDAKWSLLDYGEVVCHVFLGEQREFYDLEGLWADAPRISWKPRRPGRKKKAN